MAFTRRGKLFLFIGIGAALVIGVLVVMSAFGKGPLPKNPLTDIAGGSPSPEPGCPLTGAPPPDGEIPDRPALAIKVENLPAARPQYGLETADIIYEEPVEGGVTRFIVIYQCQDSDRVEPVRSARTTDPAFLVQFGQPLFAYADAAAYVQKAVAKVKAITDLNWQKFGSAYHEDPQRDAPHHLYTSTQELYKLGERKNDTGMPEPIFAYSEAFPDVKAKTAKQIHLEFSADYADVFWKYRGGEWVRSHGREKHTIADGGQVRADNVLVQIVKLDYTGREDVTGAKVPEVVPTGKGKAYLFRDGKVILGTWERKFAKGGVTRFRAKTGEQFLLKPGVTWVELYPSTAPKIEY